MSLVGSTIRFSTKSRRAKEKREFYYIWRSCCIVMRKSIPIYAATRTSAHFLDYLTKRKEIKRFINKEGKRERGKEGKRERGKEGKRERGKEEKKKRRKEEIRVL
jgi:hypothetical protein